MRLTQRQINLGLIGFLCVSAVLQVIITALRGHWYLVVAYGVGGGISAGLLWLYWRGWEPARYITALAVTVLVGVFLNEPFLSRSIALEVFLPPVIALVLTGPWTVVGSAGLLLGIIALRSNGQSTYFTPDNFLIYLIICGGLVFSRLAVDSAVRLAEANRRAEEARREAEDQSIALSRRNEELQQLLVEVQNQRAVINELNVPLLPIAAGALMLPLVGALDSRRMQLVQERTLAAIYALRAHTLIIDVSGVPVIDTEVSRGLIDLGQAVGLLGAAVSMVGIRSEIAQTIVGLDLDLSMITVYRDVQSALQVLGPRALKPSSGSG